MSGDFKGVFSALVTPFDESGAIDEAVLRAHVSRAIEQGVDGFAPCGSTGEFIAMSDQERMRVAEIVIDEAAGRVPVIPHTGALTTAQAVSLSRHAAEHGAAGVLSIMPFYEPIELDDARGYYSAIAEAVEVPVGVYNLPLATGVNLDPDWVGALASEIDQVCFIKDSTGDFTQLGRLVKDHGEALTVFNGADTMLLAALDLGAEAAIIGAPNIVPAECAKVYDDFVAGDHDAALETTERIYPLLQFLLSGAFYPALVKAALQLAGNPAGDPRRPVLPIAGERLERLRSILAGMGVTAS